MPYTHNPVDGAEVYFEDDAGTGPPTVFLGGLAASIDATRRLPIPQALADETRRIFVDHRGHGESATPHDPAKYATPLRVADVVAVLDALDLPRAHIMGASWGARLGFALGEHAGERVLSLFLGGQHPYAMDPDGPMARRLTQVLADDERGLSGFIEVLEETYPMPAGARADVLSNDVRAIRAAWHQAFEEGAVAENLSEWDFPCVIYAGTEDENFFEPAKRAASEIPNATFVPVEGDHLAAHFDGEPALPAFRRHLKS